MLASERDFYLRYRWALNPFPTFSELLRHLRSELAQLEPERHSKFEAWQRAEVMTNIYLLGCSLSNSIDDFLLGGQYDFSKITGFFPPARFLVRSFEAVLRVQQRLRWMRLRPLRKWRDAWEVALVEFLRNLVTDGSVDQRALCDSRVRLAALLESSFPPALSSQIPRIPSVFRSKDLTPADFLSLGRKLVDAVPDRQQPLLLVGIRSAGSYFSPLLQAYLQFQGYRDIEAMTLRPKRGLAPWERAAFARGVQRKALTIVMDESAATGGTFACTVKLLLQAGFSRKQIFLLMPVHPAGRDWTSHPEALSLSRISRLTIEPEEWHKNRLFDPRLAELRLEEYFRARGYAGVSVLESPHIERLNVELQDPAAVDWKTRLKRAYEVRLTTAEGECETRFALAKSIGWGWLSYHAFIAGERLAQFIPPVLGLRDGILYTEWVPQDDPHPMGRQDRRQLVRTVASYVAARAQQLHLETDPSPLLCRDNRDNGLDRLASLLSGAYGCRAAASLKRPRIRHELHTSSNEFPTLIDGQMWLKEWIVGLSSPRKTDFAHHGMGKYQLNLVDPVYDLADATLHLGFTREEERELIRLYSAESGDVQIGERLILCKLLAGDWAMKSAWAQLDNPHLAHRHHEFSRAYLEARQFLVFESARYCGSLCSRPERLEWRSPLVFLDIDGVLDRNVFGFQSTTAAGIQAISLLHAHGFSLALNTARTIREVQEYGDAYGFLGGVAEYGSALWDAVSRRERVLLSAESLRQVERLKNALQKIPGVFVNEQYQYSIRAITYCGERTAPLPRQMIEELMASLRVDRLHLMQNETDTTILAKEVNKGTGLRALLEWIGQPDLEAIAIGDTAPDLSMFQVAKRSFAPGQIRCRDAARMLGCRIARRSWQPGLLEIARELAHPGARRCAQCRAVERAWPRNRGLLIRLLQRADTNHLLLLLHALLDPMSLRTFEV